MYSTLVSVGPFSSRGRQAGRGQRARKARMASHCSCSVMNDMLLVSKAYFWAATAVAAPGKATVSWPGRNFLRQDPGDSGPGGAHRDGDLAGGRAVRAELGDPSLSSGERRGGRPQERPSCSSRKRAAAIRSLMASRSILAAQAMTARTTSAAGSERSKPSETVTSSQWSRDSSSSRYRRFRASSRHVSDLQLRSVRDRVGRLLRLRRRTFVRRVPGLWERPLSG